MNGKILASCIIPCYNEAPRARNVLNVVTKLKRLDEIICVDDGSTDGTGDLIANEYPHISLVRLKKNGGKSNAIVQGLKIAKGEYVLLVDADLKGLKGTELENALSVMEKGEYDMIVMRRMKHPFYVKLLRGDILIPGERIVRTDILREVLSKKVKGFQIEAALNRYALTHNLRTGWMPNSGLSVPWIFKASFWVGVKKEIDMFTDLYKYLKLKGIVNQYLYFCRNRAQ